MRRAIGKGLSQIVADQSENLVSEALLSAIVPNDRQPRRNFDGEALAGLAASIKEHGLLQPIVVRPLGDRRYELIAGERRWRAAKLAGLKSVPVTVRPATNQASLELALVENIQREDINAMECAHAYRSLADDFGLTQEQIAAKVGKSRVAVTNTLRLLKHPERIRNAISNGMISEGHARALLGFENPVHMMAVFDQVLEHGLTVKDVEQKAKSVTKTSARVSKKRSSSHATDPNLDAVADAMSNYFGSPTKIRPSGKGGEISIRYFSDEDLNRILENLGLSS